MMVTPDFVDRPSGWFFALPRGIRRASVAALGDFGDGIALDVGCGTGRSFRYLQRAGGPGCRIVGLDVSAGALARASGRCIRHGWSNVALVHGDALVTPLPDSIAAAIFTLSYASMPHRREILARIWDHLRPGGRVVVMDAKMPSGAIGRILGFGLRRLRAPGDADLSAAPWSDLSSFGAAVEMQEWAFGSYFIAVGAKV